MGENHPTEAACLIEQGATYRRRIGLKRLNTPGEPIFAGFKPGGFSLYFGDAPIYHFDLEGRWQRAFADGTHYLKGLDANAQKIDRVREGPNLILKRTTLSHPEASDFDERVRSTALELIADLDSERLARVEPASAKARPLVQDDLREFLDRIGRWDRAAWIAQRERYAAAYAMPGFLPPECQNAVLLQAKRGPAAGAGFGGSPGDSAYARSLAEFEQHAKDVAALWGRRLLQAHTVFLAGRGVLRRPVGEVTALLSVISRTLPIEPRTQPGAEDRAPASDQPRFDGVHMFLDNFDSPRSDFAGWNELARGGLVRVSLGVESGDPEVRNFYQKSWADEELRATVGNIRASGIGLSVLTLVGAGGIEHAQAHVDSAARFFQALDLGPGDFVFLLDENEIREPNTVPAGLTPLRGTAWSAERAKLKNALAPLKKRGVKVLPYTLEKQWT
jgi:hypothetical protein